MLNINMSFLWDYKAMRIAYVQTWHFYTKWKHAAFDTCWLHLQIMQVPLLCFRDCEVEIEVVAFSESFQYVYSC